MNNNNELIGCACRWDADDKRVATCVRHQGWLDVVQEWADRAKAAEAAQGQKSVATVLMHEGKKIIDGSMAFMDAAEIGQELYASPIPQQSAEPLTDVQIKEMALQEEFLLVCDGIEKLTEIVRAVEFLHSKKAIATTFQPKDKQ